MLADVDVRPNYFNRLAFSFPSSIAPPPEHGSERVAEVEN